VAGKGRGLIRLVFVVVFGIPVLWYLFLQLFGDNRFQLPVISVLGDCKGQGTVLLLKTNDLDIKQQNELNRVFQVLEKKQLRFDTLSTCGFEKAEIVLVDKKRQVRGEYQLERRDVDRFFTELDILMLVENYGEGIRR
jgi:hypothetical protein